MTELRRTVDVGIARLDVDRAARTGTPEVVYAAGKTPAETVTRSWLENIDRASDNIFVVEPQISAHMQIARFLRLGADFGYRIVAGLDTFETGDFRGFLGGIHIQVGWF